MSDNLIEKRFLYLILLSLAVHAAVFVVMLNLKEEKKTLQSEPLMVDLGEIPALPLPKTGTPQAKLQSQEWQPVTPEVATKAEAPVEKFSQSQLSQKQALPPAELRAKPFLPAVPDGRELSPRDELFRKKGGSSPTDITSLYPKADRMANLEESYRKKYESGADGETNFVSPNDYQFGSFKRRLDVAIYSVWTYPPEAAKMGIEGITLVGVTFNRKGEVVRYKLLESSGSPILDNEVLRAIKQLGPVGPLPKGYPNNTATFLFVFIYGGSQWTVRTLR